MKKLDKKDFTTKSLIGSVDYSKVKSALISGDLKALSEIYELFIRFDTQISAEIDTRRKKIASLPFMVSCDNPAQFEFLQNYLNSGDFRLLLFAMTSAIPYGFSVFFKNYKNIDGVILPKYEFLEHSYFENDKGRLFYRKLGDKIYLDEVSNTFTYLHASDTGDFINSALMYKVVCIAALKMLVINQNMNYFENLAVPPLYMQISDSDNEKKVDDALDMLLTLRSNSVGVFGKEDIISLLNGNVDKDSFLNFIRYCDESISKVITGEVLSSNAVQKGTQALGQVHAEQKKVTTEFDALILAGGVKVILKHVLELNFSEAAVFDFSFDTNTETEEEKQISVFKGLYDIGIQVPLEHLEKIFKINGLTYRNPDGVAPTAEPTTTTSEPTAARHSEPTAARHSERSEESKNEIQKNANQPKYLTNLEKEIYTHDFKPISKGVKEFINSVLSRCETYEEALNFIATDENEFSFDELENELSKAIINANLKGFE